MSLLNCKAIRLTAVLAFSLFVLGFLLQLPRVLGVEINSLITLLSGLGLVTMILSPVLMLTVTILSLFPGASRRLHLCNH